MMQHVSVREAETSLDSEGSRYSWESEEVSLPVRYNDADDWEATIIRRNEKPSWKKAPEKKVSTLQREQQNAGFRVGERPISVEDAMALLSHVASVEKLRIAYKHSQRGALLAGTAALAGGLLGGPPGIFIGGAVGGLLGWITSGQFKSVPQILKELPDAEKRKLYAAVKAVVKNLQWSDVSQLFHLAMANPTVRAKLVGVLNDYFRKRR